MPKLIMLNVVAYLCACLAAGLIISVTSSLWLFRPPSAELLDWHTLPPLVGLTAFFGSLTFAISAIPSGVAIYFARLNKVQNLVWFAVVGAMIGLLGAIFHLGVLLFGPGETVRDTLKNPIFWRLSIFEVVILPFAGAISALIFGNITRRYNKPTAT